MKGGGARHSLPEIMTFLVLETADIGRNLTAVAGSCTLPCRIDIKGHADANARCPLTVCASIIFLAVAHPIPLPVPTVSPLPLARGQGGSVSPW